MGSVVLVRGLSSCGSQALECRLSSCGARAQVLCGMWDPPGPGITPVSPALAGGFLTIAPPGKSIIFLLILIFPYKILKKEPPVIYIMILKLEKISMKK